MTTLFEKFNHAFNYGNITLHTRPYLKAHLKETYKGFNINNINSGSPCLFYNGRSIFNSSILSKIESIDEQSNTIITYKNTIIVAFID